MKLSRCIIASLLATASGAAAGENAVIWASHADSIAVQTVEGGEELCLSGKAYLAPDEGDGEFLKILPNK